MRNKISLIILVLLAVFACQARATTAFNIEWWSSQTGTGLPGDTLMLWAERIEGEVGFPENMGTGKIWYVDSGVSVEGDGSSWTNAYDTIQEAIDASSTDSGANRGDRVYVAQGHEENIASGAAIDVDVAGLTIVGHGSGVDMPEFTMTATGSTFQISAADVIIYNLRFLGGKTGGTTECIDVTADGDGYKIIGCEFNSQANTTELLKMITITADADWGVISGNRFIDVPGGDSSIAINLEGGSDKSVISYNDFLGDWSGYVLDGSTAASTGLSVHHNCCFNVDTDAGYTFGFNSGTSGYLYTNHLYGNGASFAIVGNAMFISPDNVATNQEDVETATYFDMLGAFTGPASGTAQAENIKASLDLAHTDLDSIITAVAGGFFGTATTTTDTTTTTDNTMTGFHDEYFNTDWVLVILHDSGNGQAAPEGEIVDITDYDQATGVFTHAALSQATDTGDMFWVTRKEEVLHTDTITATTIADNAIDAGAIAANAIAASEIADDAIDAGAIATGAIDADAIATNAIGAAEIAADAITSAEIANDAIGATEIATGAIDADAIATDAIGAAEIADDAIDAGAIAADAITASEIADNAIDAGAIATDAIDADAIATAAITNAELETDCIGSAEIATDAIGADEIATDAIGADELASTAVAEIAAGIVVVETSGSVYYVDSAGDNSDGLSWSTAKTTLSAGVGLATASANDKIYVGAGHTENITATGGLTMNKIGVQVIGCGKDTLRPTFTFTTNTGADIEIDNPCSFENIIFDCASLDAMLAPIDVDAAGVIFKNCLFYVADAAAQAVTTINLDANADRFWLDNCRFEGGANDGPGSVVTMVATAPEYVKITDCWFEADCDNGVIYGTGTPSNILIEDCHVSNLNTGVAAIVFTSTATGVIKDTTISTDAYATAIDPGTCEIYNVIWYDSDAPADNVGVPILAANANGAAQIGTADLDAIEGEATDAIEADLLDHFMSAATADTADPVDIVAGEVADNSVLAHIMTQDGDVSGFERVTDSMEALAIALETIQGASGDIYYVDSAAGTDDTVANGYGKSWAAPFDTIDYALSQATHNNGDIILVAAGHTTTLGDSQESYADAGITVIGLGFGYDMATIVFDNANSSIDVTGDGITLVNLRFSSTTAATTMTLDVDGDRFSLIGCEFTETGDFEHVISVDLGADCENALIQGCSFDGAGTGASSAIAITGGVIDNCRIIDCKFWGNFTNAAIYSNQINTNMYIDDCVISNRNAANHAIEFSDATTGVIRDCDISTNAYATAIDPGSCMVYDTLWYDTDTPADAVGIPVLGISAGGAVTIPDTDLANIELEATDAIEADLLQKLQAEATADTADPVDIVVTEVADDSVLGQIMAQDGDASSFERLTDSLEGLGVSLNTILGSAGEVWYVDDAGTDSTYASSGYGVSWSKPFDTIDYALSQATENDGAVILVRPGHTTTLGATQESYADAGITVIGMGVGENMSKIVFDDVASSIDITASMTIINMWFESTTADTTIGLDIEDTADGTSIIGCLFTNASGLEFLTAIDVKGGADRITLRGNTIINTGGADALAAIGCTDNICDRLIIADNLIMGKYDSASIYCDKVNTLGVIEDNDVYNDETGIHAIEFSGNATGIIKNNMLYTDTYGVGLDPGYMHCFGNKHSYATDMGAIDVPLVPGKQYTLMAAQASVTATTDPLFTIAGGPIKIVDFYGVVTTQMGNSDITIQSIDTATTTTFPYSNTVTCDGDVVGTTYTFTGAIPSVLTPLTGAHNRSATPDIQWYAPIGTVDQLGDAAVAGVIEWYMTFIPLTTGVIVTDAT